MAVCAILPSRPQVEKRVELPSSLQGGLGLPPGREEGREEGINIIGSSLTNFYGRSIVAVCAILPSRPQVEKESGASFLPPGRARAPSREGGRKGRRYQYYR